MKLKNKSDKCPKEQKMKKKMGHPIIPIALHAEDLKVKCPNEEKKKETKYTLAFHAEGKKVCFKQYLC